MKSLAQAGRLTLLWWWLHDQYWLAHMWFTDVRTPRVVRVYVRHLEEENWRLSQEIDVARARCEACLECEECG